MLWSSKWQVLVENSKGDNHHSVSKDDILRKEIAAKFDGFALIIVVEAGISIKPGYILRLGYQHAFAILGYLVRYQRQNLEVRIKDLVGCPLPSIV